MLEAQAFAEMVLMFHSVDPWNDKRRQAWVDLQALVGIPADQIQKDATTRTLCDAARFIVKKNKIQRPTYEAQIAVSPNFVPSVHGLLR